MKKFIFIFPKSHPLGRHYQPVYAESSKTARERMNERYGAKWTLYFTEKEWDEWVSEAKAFGLELEIELAPIYSKEKEPTKPAS